MPAMSGAAGFESSKRLETRSQGAKDRKAQAMKRYGGQTAKAVNTVGLAIGQTRVAFSGTPVDIKGADFLPTCSSGSQRNLGPCRKGADFQTLPEHSPRLCLQARRESPRMDEIRGSALRAGVDRTRTPAGADDAERMTN